MLGDFSWYRSEALRRRCTRTMANRRFRQASARTVCDKQGESSTTRIFDSGSRERNHVSRFAGSLALICDFPESIEQLRWSTLAMSLAERNALARANAYCISALRTQQYSCVKQNGRVAPCKSPGNYWPALHLAAAGTSNNARRKRRRVPQRQQKRPSAGAANVLQVDRAIGRTGPEEAPPPSRSRSSQEISSPGRFRSSRICSCRGSRAENRAAPGLQRHRGPPRKTSLVPS